MSLNRPHGGVLIHRIAQKLNIQNITGTIEIDEMALSDLELIANGAYSPLDGFMTREDYESVIERMRLKNGILWSIPITLPVDEKTAQMLQTGKMVKLNYNNETYGVMNVYEVYESNKEKEAVYVYGTSDRDHPGVKKLFARPNIYVAGKITLLKRPKKEFPEYHFDPFETREKFQQLGWKTIAGIPWSSVANRTHEYMHKIVLEIVDGLFFHPLIGASKESDFQADVLIESYEVLFSKFYPLERVWFALFPASMRFAGPKEAIFHAIVRKNYGCTHFVIEPDYAGVGNYYGTYDAQKLARLYADEIGMTILHFKRSFYCKVCQQIASEKTCPHSRKYHVFLSDETVKEMLKYGKYPPPELIRPEVIHVLTKMKNKQA